MEKTTSFDELLLEVAAAHHSALAVTKDLEEENSHLRSEVARLQSALSGEFSLVSSCHSLPGGGGRRHTLPSLSICVKQAAPEDQNPWSEEVKQPHTSVALELQGGPAGISQHDSAVEKALRKLPSTSSQKGYFRDFQRLGGSWGRRTLSSQFFNSNLSNLSEAATDVCPLWSAWTEKRTSFLSTTSAMLSTNSLGSLGSALKRPISKIRGGDVLTENNCFQCMVIGPNSRKRTAWDLLSLLCVGHDILTVPLIAFDALDAPFVQITSLLTTLFWTLDLPVSFLSGYYHGGAIEMRPSMLARHYIRRWFSIDILVLVTDWILISLSSGLADIVGLARVSKTLRLSRILRVFRLIRVMKVPELMEDIIGSFASEGLVTALGVLRSVLLIIILNHFIACGWYAISFVGPVDRRWVAEMDSEGRDDLYRYATALHWSLTQFTPASMEVRPHNIYERIYSIIVLISAMVTFSTFISSITTMMTTLRRIGTEKSKQREYIRKYVLENHLSIELGNKISIFLRDQKGIGRKRIHESDIQVLKLLPEALTLQLHFEVYSWRLVPHPFFYHLVENDENGVVEICHRAMSELSLRTSEELFSAGQTATRSFVLLSGTPEFQTSQNTSEVDEGQWISEVVMWVQWAHRGRLAAKTHCEFISLDSNSFRQVLTRRPHVVGACRSYARRYRERVLQLPPGHPVDIWCNFDMTQELAQTSFDKAMEMPSHHPSHGLANLWRTWSPRLYHWRRAWHTERSTTI